MQRLVYTPKVYAFTKRADGEILNISNYITAGQVNRRINAVSNVQLTLRNPKMIFTTPDSFNQVAFTPMDPITIFLKRLRGRPVRVFTGYLDKTPYLQLYPGVIELKASCTLKRLLYTYFDPALPYTMNFLMAYGWAPVGNGTWFSQDALNDWQARAASDAKGQKDESIDSSVSNLLFATLKYIGRWDPEQILVERLPKDLFTRLTQISNEFQADNEEAWAEMQDLFKRVIGEGDYGNGDGSTPTDPVGSATGGPDEFRQAANNAGAKYGVDPAVLMGIAEIESGFGTAVGSKRGGSSSAGALGPMQFMPDTWKAYGDGVADHVYEIVPAVNAAAKYLKASGAPDYQKAIFAYNHAQWYVDDVLKRAAKYGYPTHSPLEPLAIPGDLAPQKVTRSSSSSSKTSTSSGNLTSPIKGMPTAGWPGPGGSYGAPRTYGGHKGVDAPSTHGAPWYSITDGEVVMINQNWANGQPAILIKSTQQISGYPNPLYLGYGSFLSVSVKKGDTVTAGQKLGLGGEHGGGPHLHFYLADNPNATNGTMDPTAFLKSAAAGREPTGGPGGSLPEQRGPVFNLGDSLAVGTAASLRTTLDTKVITIATVGINSTVGLSMLIDNKDKLTNTVIVQLGSNDSSVSTFKTNINAIMKELGSSRRVFWVNRKRTDDSLDTAMNKALDDAAQKYSNLTILDWNSEVNSGRATLADNVHPTSPSVRSTFIAKTVKSAIPSSGSSTGSSTGAAASAAQTAAAGAFFGTLNLPTLLEEAEAVMLGGEKSLMNDKPLMPFIQQLCEASLRQFQSMPDGKFFAFYPDYFGEMDHRPPYWEIDDIEVMDGSINLTDDSLVTHMYVVGDTINPLSPSDQTTMRSVLTSGVVTVFNAFMSDDTLARQDTAATAKAKKEAAKRAQSDDKTPKAADDPRGLDIILDRAEAVQFLQRYGARPHVDDMPMIKHAFFEMFLAYQRFMLAWSKQFESIFTFTFMPELFPGGKLGFPDHGLQMYIEEVTHSFDYTSGFTTQAVLSAPSIYGGNPRNLPPNMVRAIIEPTKNNPDTPHGTKKSTKLGSSHLSSQVNK